MEPASSYALLALGVSGRSASYHCTLIQFAALLVKKKPQVLHQKYVTGQRPTLAWEESPEVQNKGPAAHKYDLGVIKPV